MRHTARGYRQIARNQYRTAAAYLTEARAWRARAGDRALFSAEFSAERVRFYVALARLGARTARSWLRLAESTEQAAREP